MRRPKRHQRGSQQICLPLADLVSCEADLVAIALALGARNVPCWSAEEESLAQNIVPIDKKTADDYREQIRAGDDPLGTQFCELRSAAQRREKGATYTPQVIVDAMADGAAERPTASRVVDPGAGSARYLLAVAKRLPTASLIGVEIDPLSSIVARGNLAAAGHAARAQVILGDYRGVSLPTISGRTLFIGNPPYVRHHAIGSDWKQWFVREAAGRKLAASQLAGLHVHFFLATAGKASPGDYGAFITAAEWLDVNYGSLLRELFLRDLGGRRIVVVEPAAMPFPDAATTAAITYFEVGSAPDAVQLKRVDSLKRLNEPNGNHLVRRERLEAERRWTHLTRPARRGPAGYIELGELCRVHRGQVTGANHVWIAGPHSEGLPDAALFPAVTKARELFGAGRALLDPSHLRRVIDLPIDLDVFSCHERRLVDRFLAKAKAAGADVAYVAVNRKAWWSVGLREPAPILATYMARRPPAFVLNHAQARHINIAHGLYPRDHLDELVLERLAAYLNEATNVGDGRTYAGGLTKFEPREMERLLVPGVDSLMRDSR